MNVERAILYPADIGWRAGPIRDYYVAFWTQGVAADGVPQEIAMWREELNQVASTDVTEVIEWAEREAAERSAIYTVFARIEFGDRGPGIVWLAGADPSVNADNFDKPRPADAKPMAGGTEPYRGRN